MINLLYYIRPHYGGLWMQHSTFIFSSDVGMPHAPSEWTGDATCTLLNEGGMSQALSWAEEVADEADTQQKHHCNLFQKKMLSPYCIDRETPLRPSVLNVYQYTYLNCSLSLHVLAVYDSVGNPTHTTNSMVSSSGPPHSSIKACEYQIASYIKMIWGCHMHL